MSDRRMFSKSITESDAFTDLPFASQALYLQLSMNADDDGFINNARRIVKVMGAKEEDLAELVDKAFLIKFESGIYVIKHWKVNNKIRSDRKKDTNYPEEKSMLIEKKTGVYSLKSPEQLAETKDPSEGVQDDEDSVLDNTDTGSSYDDMGRNSTTEDVKKVKYEAESEARKDYSGEIFDLYFSNQLPCPKDVITFTIRDFKLALQSIKELYLSSEDVIAATKNYVEVVKLGRKGESWWDSEQTFNSFCEKKTILKFLPENFKIEQYYKRKPGASSVVEDKIQL